MEVKFLWAQEVHKNSQFQVHKIAGDRNPADVLTKPKSAADMREKLAIIGANIVNRGDWMRIGIDSRVRWADLETDDLMDESD